MFAPKTTPISAETVLSFEEALSFFEKVHKELEINPNVDAQAFQSKLLSILQNRLPTCPPLCYVTEANLKRTNSTYNSNQTFYAYWCHFTACTLVERVKNVHLAQLIRFCAYSRWLLAKACKTDRAELFGLFRFQLKKTLPLTTPLQVPVSIPRSTHPYTPWYKINKYAEKKVVHAVSPSRKKIPGTRRGLHKYEDGEKLFSWMHGMDRRLAHCAQDWFERAVEASPSEQLETIGKFYYAMVQYTPLKRGSATVSMILMNTLFMYHHMKMPKAVTLLDCYALSMQQHEFVKDVFIPVAHEAIGNQELLKLLKKKERCLLSKKMTKKSAPQ